MRSDSKDGDTTAEVTKNIKVLQKVVEVDPRYCQMSNGYSSVKLFEELDYTGSRSR